MKKLKHHIVIWLLISVSVWFVTSQVANGDLKLAREESNRVERAMAAKNRVLKDSIRIRDSRIANYEAQIAINEMQIDSLKSEAGKIDTVIIQIPSNVQDLNRSETVSLINKEYTDQTGDSDTTQDLTLNTLKFLAVNVLENKERKRMIDVMRAQEDAFEQRISSTDSINAQLKLTIQDLETISSNKDEIINAKDDEIKQQRKKIRNVTVVTVLAAVAGFLIGGIAN